MDTKPDLKAEIDFKDLIRKPEKLFGYSFILFVLVLTVLGISYMQNLTSIGKNTVTPAVLTDSASFVRDIPFQSARSLPPVDVMKVSTATPELIANGKELFRTHCASCHGDNGEGDGATAVTLNPKPRNFHQLAGWKNGSKVSQIYKTLQEGIPGSAMASFNYVSPLDRFAMIHFVRSLATGQPVDSQPEIQGLEATYQLSKGTNTPGQIPIKKVVQIVEAEAAAKVTAIAVLAATAGGETKGTGYKVFERVARDKNRIFASLLSNTSASLQSVDQFIRVVSAEPIQLGFKAEVVQLSASDWTALYQFMNELKARRG
ncbi:MAG: cytochrome c [Ignavibacteriales bacterium]|nr:cytochrome c [Ignavibacteriales bacterium]